MSDVDFLRRVVTSIEHTVSKWDIRNYRFASPTEEQVRELPDEFDGLAAYLSSYDQGSIGTCVGWAGKMTREASELLLSFAEMTLSAFWLYIKSREKSIPPVPPHIEGSTCLGLMRALHKIGATTEKCCPTPTKHPIPKLNACDNAEKFAEKFKIASYWSVATNPNDMRWAIFGKRDQPYDPDWMPLIVAIPIYDSFLDGGWSGVVPMPKADDQLLGAHCTIYTGWTIQNNLDTYDGPKPKFRDSRHWINHGSWGRRGDRGRFYIPEGYPIYEAWTIVLPGGEPRPKPWWVRLWDAFIQWLRRWFGPIDESIDGWLPML